MAEIQLGEIGQIAIPVQDVEKAIAFYRDTLGMAFMFKAPPGLAFFRNGDVRLMLSEPESGDFTPRSSIIYYRVPDVYSAVESLRGKGATITGEPHMIAKMPDHELWMAFFEDQDGNPLAIMEERR